TPPSRGAPGTVRPGLQARSAAARFGTPTSARETEFPCPSGRRRRPQGYALARAYRSATSSREALPPAALPPADEALGPPRPAPSRAAVAGLDDAAAAPSRLRRALPRGPGARRDAHGGHELRRPSWPAAPGPAVRPRLAPARLARG